MVSEEKSPLITSQIHHPNELDNINSIDGANEAEVDLKPEDLPRKFGHYLMGLCIFFNLYSYLYFMFVMTQYAYFYFAKEKFPNSTNLNNNNGGSESCGNHINKNSTISRERTEVQVLASHWSILAGVASIAPAIIMDIFLGSLSDRYGRKPLVVTSLVGTFLKTGLFSLGVYMAIDINYFFIFLVLEGLTGGWSMSLSLGYAYVSDITASGKGRTIAIALVDVCCGIGIVLSGVTSGYLIKDTGYSYSFLMVAIVSGVNLLMVLCFLPETLKTSKRHKKNILHMMKNAFSFYIKDTSEQGKRWKYILGILSFSFFTFTVVGRQSIEQLYEINAPFCWNSVKIGWYTSICDAVRNVIGMSFIKLFRRCFLDEILVIISGISSACGFILEALAYNDVMLMLVPAIGIFSMIASPVIRATLSKLTAADQQGALFAGMAVVQAACALLGEVMTKSIYASTVGSFRGFVFLVYAGLALLMVLFFSVLFIASRSSRTKGTGILSENISEPTHSLQA